MNRPGKGRRAAPLAAALGLALAAASSHPAAAARLELVPPPAQLDWMPGAAALAADWTVRVPAGSAADTFAANLLIEDVRARFGWRWSVAATGGPAVILRPLRPSHRATENWAREGYELDVWIDSIVVRAPTAAGRYRGVQTLRQILRGVPGPEVPGLLIRDGPALAWRGLAEEFGDELPAPAELSRTLATLGYYKANLYRVTVPAAPDTARARRIGERLAALAAEAKLHHVELVAGIESLAPASAVLPEGFVPPAEPRLPWAWPTAGLWIAARVHDLLAATAAAAGGPWRPAFEAPEGRALIYGRIAALLHAVPGGWFHLGGDAAGESPHGGRFHAVAGHEAALAGWISQLARLADGRHGRRVMVDAHELLRERRALDRLPRTLTPVLAAGRAGDDEAALFALRRAGFARVHVAVSIADGWPLPELERAFHAVARMTDRAAEARAEGLIATRPRRGDPPACDEIAVAHALEAGWAGVADSARGFVRRFVAAEFGLAARGPAEALARLASLDRRDAAVRAARRDPRLERLAPGLPEALRALERDLARSRAGLAAGRHARWNAARIAALDHAARTLSHGARRGLLLHEIAALDSAARAGRAGAVPARRLRALRDEALALAGAGDPRLARDAAALDSLGHRLFPARFAAGAPADRRAPPARLTRAERRRLAALRLRADALEVSPGW